MITKLKEITDIVNEYSGLLKDSGRLWRFGYIGNYNIEEDYISCNLSSLRNMTKSINRENKINTVLDLHTDDDSVKDFIIENFSNEFTKIEIFDTSIVPCLELNFETKFNSGEFYAQVYTNEDYEINFIGYFITD